MTRYIFVRWAKNSKPYRSSHVRYLELIVAVSTEFWWVCRRGDTIKGYTVWSAYEDGSTCHSHKLGSYYFANSTEFDLLELKEL